MPNLYGFYSEMTKSRLHSKKPAKPFFDPKAKRVLYTVATPERGLNAGAAGRAYSTAHLMPAETHLIKRRGGR